MSQRVAGGKTEWHQDNECQTANNQNKYRNQEGFQVRRRLLHLRQGQLDAIG